MTVCEDNNRPCYFVICEPCVKAIVQKPIHGFIGDISFLTSSNSEIEALRKFFSNCWMYPFPWVNYHWWGELNFPFAQTFPRTVMFVLWCKPASSNTTLSLFSASTFPCFGDSTTPDSYILKSREGSLRISNTPSSKK